MKYIFSFLIFIIHFQGFTQDRYAGEFSKDQFFVSSDDPLPFGTHIGFTAKNSLKTVVDYGQNGAIQTIYCYKFEKIICAAEISFPAIKPSWTLIKPGLWISTSTPTKKW